MNFRPIVIILYFIWIVTTSGFSQDTYTIRGQICDELGASLPGAAVLIKPQNKATLTDVNGKFSFQNLPKGDYVLKVQYLGYSDLIDTIFLTENLQMNYHLTTSVATLKEVVVIDHYADERKKDIPVSSDVVDSKYINKNLGNTLVNSLERLPGVDAINIGSGQAKPVIRGLSFNRVVVVENGITHEGQQWGADHGLEIDQFAVDRAEVIRGPASLIYGSDAIGGVIDLRQLYTPEQGTLAGDINLIGKSNNNLVGGSASVGMAGKKLFFILRTTWLDWADYKVPADFVDIYSFRMPLYRHSLRNTAGDELNLHLTTGYTHRNFSSRFFISMVSSKSGFFANAHGLEPRNVDTVLHDANQRDVLNPYQTVKHYKLQNQSRWQLKKGYIESVIGYQLNKRQEISDYVSHGYMPPVFPGELSFNPELERSFDKNILSGNLKASYNPRNSLNFMAGLSLNFHENKIGGRGFIIPEYQQFNAGAFLYAKKQIGEKGSLQGGLRYDIGSLNIESYTDWFQSAVIVGLDTSWQYLQRASNIEKTFGNISWSLGYNYVTQRLLFKVNLGKSFRLPIAKELAANGVNYHYFRYEKGNIDLNPEEAYQLDAGLELAGKKLIVGITPFVTWFTNYIYLNPSWEHDRLYGNGNQIFDYTEADVLRFGSEIHSHYDICRNWKAGFVAEYLFSEQMSGSKKGFSLPFSPPPSMMFNLKFNPKKAGFLVQPYISTDLKLVAAQNRIVPPEEITKGYYLVNLSFGGTISLGKTDIQIGLQIHNLLNNNYFNHTSYYRLINLPEAGRNFILNIQIPFKTFLNKN